MITIKTDYKKAMIESNELVKDIYIQTDLSKTFNHQDTIVITRLFTQMFSLTPKPSWNFMNRIQSQTDHQTKDLNRNSTMSPTPLNIIQLINSLFIFTIKATTNPFHLLKKRNQLLLWKEINMQNMHGIPPYINNQITSLQNTLEEILAVKEDEDIQYNSVVIGESNWSTPMVSTLIFVTIARHLKTLQHQTPKKIWIWTTLSLINHNYNGKTK